MAQSDGNSIVSDVKGTFGEITPEDDGTDKIEMKGKALILYASITTSPGGSRRPLSTTA